MGSGALVLVWSHPFTYANISLLSLHDTVTFPSSLRFSIIICPDEDRFDTFVLEARTMDTRSLATNFREEKKNIKTIRKLERS